MQGHERSVQVNSKIIVMSPIAVCCQQYCCKNKVGKERIGKERKGKEEYELAFSRFFVGENGDE